MKYQIPHSESDSERLSLRFTMLGCDDWIFPLFPSRGKYLHKRRIHRCLFNATRLDSRSGRDCDAVGTDSDTVNIQGSSLSGLRSRAALRTNLKRRLSTSLGFSNFESKSRLFISTMRKRFTCKDFAFSVAFERNLCKIYIHNPSSLIKV